MRTIVIGDTHGATMPIFRDRKPKMRYTYRNGIAMPGGAANTPGASQRRYPMTELQHTPTTDNQQEEWRAVIGWEGLYEVSDQGRVRRVDGRGQRSVNGCLTTTLNNMGYPRVTLTRQCKSVSALVHRLVAAAFLGPCPAGHEVNHRDSNRANPHYSNLEYVTRSGNIDHALRHGLMPRGASAPNARLTEEAARAIRHSSEPGVVLARRYGVSQTTVCEIRQGKRWRHVV